MAAIQSGTKVKICGVTSLHQAIEIVNAGANFIGLNFWPQSKRFLGLKHAFDLMEWKCAMPDRAQLVGVFVNPSIDHEYFSDDSLDAIQLHGDETPEFCAKLQARGFRVIKAIQVRDAATLDLIAAYPTNDILLDAYHPNERGGLGATFPWELACEFKRRFPGRTLWLAGGLTQENVGEAVRGVQPFAVDVASGVESGVPGVKDMAKVRAFISGAKTAG